MMIGGTGTVINTNADPIVCIKKVLVFTQILHIWWCALYTMTVFKKFVKKKKCNRSPCSQYHNILDCNLCVVICIFANVQPYWTEEEREEDRVHGCLFHKILLNKKVTHGFDNPKVMARLCLMEGRAWFPTVFLNTKIFVYLYAIVWFQCRGHSVY